MSMLFSFRAKKEIKDFSKKYAKMANGNVHIVLLCIEVLREL